MKNLIIGQIGHAETILFAADELRRYLGLMDDTAQIDIVEYPAYDSTRTDLLWVGRDETLQSRLPAVEDPLVDDAILVDVQDFAGVLSGVNDRSVLLSVYRFLRELGCAFVRPGKDGEVIPNRDLEVCEVHLCERPSYRNRVVCIEGANTYQNVYDMVDWLPKVGLNGYLVQFSVPYDFFDRWYSHAENPGKETIPFDNEMAKGIHNRIRHEQQKRSLFLSEVGHGWTCDPFGVVMGGWSKFDENDPIPDCIAPYLAEVNGKRAFFNGCPFDTQICYSNKKARDIMTDAMVKYCDEHPTVTHLNVWLADGMNNHCECEACRQKTPSDWMVVLLNELDEKMTAAGHTAKVIFPAYVDTLFPPETERFNNPGRFILEFAPITRHFRQTFKDIDASKEIEVKPYIRNRNSFPGAVAPNLQFMKNWLKTCPGVDSFDFDYHMWTAHLYDGGYMANARVMHDDVQALANFGINGFVSCQVQRVSMPNNLTMVEMAETLWNKEADFDAVCDKHFADAFGVGWQDAKEYCTTVSQKISTFDYYGDEYFAKLTKAQKIALVDEALTYMERFKETVARRMAENEHPTHKLSWSYLPHHIEIWTCVAKMLRARYEQNKADFIKWRDASINYARAHEDEIQPAFDVWRWCRAYLGDRYKIMEKDGEDIQF